MPWGRSSLPRWGDRGRAAWPSCGSRERPRAVVLMPLCVPRRSLCLQSLPRVPGCPAARVLSALTSVASLHHAGPSSCLVPTCPPPAETGWAGRCWSGLSQLPGWRAASVLVTRRPSCPHAMDRPPHLPWPPPAGRQKSPSFLSSQFCRLSVSFLPLLLRQRVGAHSL